MSLYGTGFGLTDPAFAAGELPDRTTSTVAQVTVMIADRQLDDSAVIYTGVQPGTAGVYRLDIHLPDDLPEGNLPIVAIVGGFSSPAGGYLTVKLQQ